jgi:hypothetical protein
VVLRECCVAMKHGLTAANGLVSNWSIAARKKAAGTKPAAGLIDA